MGKDRDADLAEHFIIFSLARCGSTTLTRIVNCYPGIRCVIEPFTPSNESTKYRSVSDSDVLDSALAEIWQEYNGIKHIWDPSGFPFGDTLELNRRLLLDSPSRIIFLTRRNNLRRIVSDEISWQTQVWGTFSDADRQRVLEFAYQPLRIERIEWQIDADAKTVPAVLQMLSEANKPTLELFYEDIFDERAELEERLRKIDVICRFLGAGKVQDDSSRRLIESLLDHKRGKLNSAETYGRIPRIREIEKRFGSDQSGWLFDENSERER